MLQHMVGLEKRCHRNQPPDRRIGVHYNDSHVYRVIKHSSNLMAYQTSEQVIIVEIGGYVLCLRIVG